MTVNPADLQDQTLVHSQDDHAPGDEHGKDHDAHGYSFMKSLTHHTLPWPAWEIAHKPLVVFNSARYADYNYDYFASKPGFAEAEPSANQLGMGARLCR